ncbi:MAG: hypothetical protein ACO2Z1_05195 [Pontimonas sp.]
MHTISLVTDVYLSKTEALDALSQCLQLPISDPGSADPWLQLERGVGLHIEVPKFGEDLPLTLDITGRHSAHVEAVSRALRQNLHSLLGWSVSRLDGSSR